MAKTVAVTGALLGMCGGARGEAQADTTVDVAPAIAAFHADIGAQAAKAMAAGANAVAGSEGWLFFAPELRHLSVGRFWGDKAADVSRATGAGADPIPAIVNFNTELRRRGIRLFVVPVPPKAAVWPDKVADAPDAATGADAPRADPWHAAFYKELGKQGVDVLDLTPILRAGRRAEHGAVYCRHDTHWSGAGVVVAAEALAAKIRKVEGFEAPADGRFNAEWDEVEIVGDLVSMLPGDAPKPDPEKLDLRFITAADGSAPEVDAASPVLLMGDSHTLVFHAGGDLHARGAGLPDQLAYELGRPVDLIGTRGSGATTVRIDLYRRARRDGDYLAGKKVVVWCFTARDFTESNQGWRVLPVSP